MDVVQRFLVEETPLLSKDVGKQKSSSNFMLDRARNKSECFISVTRISVVAPKVNEVLFNFCL